MAGSGSGSGGGSGSGSGFEIGGVYVSIPYIDEGVPYAQEIMDASICAAILQMTARIQNSVVSAAIRSAAASGLGIETAQLAKEASSAM